MSFPSVFFYEIFFTFQQDSWPSFISFAVKYHEERLVNPFIKLNNCLQKQKHESLEEENWTKRREITRIRNDDKKGKSS